MNLVTTGVKPPPEAKRTTAKLEQMNKNEMRFKRVSEGEGWGSRMVSLSYLGITQFHPEINLSVSLSPVNLGSQYLHVLAGFSAAYITGSMINFP